MKKRITIGITAAELEKTTSRAGIARILFELLKYITKIPGIEKRFRIILYFRASIPKEDFLKHPVFEKKVLKFIKPSFTLYYNFLLPLVTKKDGVDVMFFTTFMLPLLYFGKSIVIIHDTIYKAHPEWFPWLHRISYKVLIDHATRKASKIFTLTESAKKDIVKYYKVKPERVVIASPGIGKEFRPIKDGSLINKVKNKYNIKKDFIFYTGQILVRRRTKESILAFEKIANKFPDFQFLVSHRDLTYPSLHIDELAKKVNERLGREAILRTIFVDEKDLPVLYSSAKLFVYASEYEGFGLPPAEATMCGTPALTGANEAASEIFGEKGAFFVKNPTNVNEQAKVMCRALTKPEACTEVVRAGQKNLSKYTWEKYSQKILNVWKNV